MRIQQKPNLPSQLQSRHARTAAEEFALSSLQPLIAHRTKGPLEAMAELEQWRQGEQTGSRQAVRWHAEQLPLRVFIEPPPDANGQTTARLFGIIRQWEAASLGQIRFENISDLPALASEADILIRWTSEAVVGRDYEVGHTKRELQGGRWIRRAIITLLTEPLIDAHLTPQAREQRLQATLLHEVGHALGLEHSRNPTDVMHYRGWRNTLLSERDCSEVQTLYPAAPTLRWL